MFVVPSIETTVMGNTQKLVRCMRFKIHDVITPARAALLRDINRKPVVPNHGNTSTQCTETESLTYVCKFENIWVVNC